MARCVPWKRPSSQPRISECARESSSRVPSLMSGVSSSSSFHRSGGQSRLKLAGDLAVNPRQVVDRARLGLDPAGFLQDLAGHAGDPHELLRIEHLRWSSGASTGAWGLLRARRSGSRGSCAMPETLPGHATDVGPNGQRCLESKNGPESPLEPLTPSPYASVIYSATRTRSKVGPKRPGCPPGARWLRVPPVPAFLRTEVRSVPFRGRPRGPPCSHRPLRPLGTGRKVARRRGLRVNRPDKPLRPNGSHAFAQVAPGVRDARKNSPE